MPPSLMPWWLKRSGLPPGWSSHRVGGRICSRRNGMLHIVAFLDFRFLRARPRAVPPVRRAGNRP